MKHIKTWQFGPFCFGLYMCKNGQMLVKQLILTNPNELGAALWIEEELFLHGAKVIDIISRSGEWAERQLHEWQKAVNSQVNAFERKTELEKPDEA